MWFKKQYIIVKKKNNHSQGPKKPPELEIEPGTFVLIEVKYKCPGIDPNIGMFLRSDSF